ncbi:ArsR family transcriptional regulator [Candidatus Thorarchaeota archaeon]|nr:MAG: ArsR family transcriptional regulator [Candidatus Thorarchaeota archaeon]
MESAEITNRKDTERMANMFRAIANESRLRILILLMRGESTNVSEIADRIGLSVSSVSHHMSKLDDLGFVRRERRGKEVYYHLDDYCIRDIIERAEKHVSGQ